MPCLRAQWESFTADMGDNKRDSSLQPPPALVRAYQETQSPLTLNLPYYAARKGEGFALIPWDRYMEEAEGLLQGLGEEGP